jgi:2'-5' RNA ligase
MGGPLASLESAMRQPDVARLFLAVWPDAAARAQLAAYRDGWRWPPGARPVTGDKLHLTLHFIGDFDRARIAALAGALAPVAMLPTVLRADRPEVWRGGIAVLRLRADAHLSALHAALGEILRAEGFHGGLSEMRSLLRGLHSALSALTSSGPAPITRSSSRVRGPSGSKTWSFE